jgi:hypothetical protein
MLSSFAAHLSILAMLFRFMPIEKVRSQRKCSKPSLRRVRATRDTWELSMAWREMPLAVTSKLASVISSRVASSTFSRKGKD